MKLFSILLLVASSAFAQTPDADLSARINALTQECEASLAAQARRSATLAAELASMQAKLKVATETADKCKPEEKKK